MLMNMRASGGDPQDLSIGKNVRTVCAVDYKKGG